MRKTKKTTPAIFTSRPGYSLCSFVIQVTAKILQQLLRHIGHKKYMAKIDYGKQIH